MNEKDEKISNGALSEKDEQILNDILKKADDFFALLNEIEKNVSEREWTMICYGMYLGLGDASKMSLTRMAMVQKVGEASKNVQAFIDEVMKVLQEKSEETNDE